MSARASEALAPTSSSPGLKKNGDASLDANSKSVHTKAGLFSIISAMATSHDPTRRAFMRALAAEGALLGGLWGCFAAAATALALRVLPCSAAGVRILPCYALALIPIAALAGVVLALRRTPSRGACAALTEDATHAGGLLLVEDLPGADAWKHPEPVAADVPVRIRRHLPKAILSLTALVAAFAVPASWFAATAPSVPRAFPDITADIRNEIEDIREDESLEPETIDELAEELKRIEAAADPSDPGAALDAAERLRERVAALLELNSETLKRVVQNSDALAQIANDPEAAKEFQKMLDESSAGSCPNGEERPGGEAECEGGEEGPGAGSPERGRGDAEMSWTDPAKLGDSKYNDRSQELKPGENAEEGKVGESISQEDPTAKGATSARAATAIGGRAAGTSVNRTVAPRPRGTVTRFFETERNQP